MKIRTARRLVCLLLAVPMTMALLPVRAEAQRTPSGGPVVIVRPPPPKGLGYELVQSSPQRTESGKPVLFALSCPTGKAVVSGGVSNTNLTPKAYFHIINSYPRYASVGPDGEKYPSQWAFAVINDTTPGVITYLMYHVVCVNPS